ncbi:hypothetical protein GF342_04485 [Candidatus Woesearchaeota archaeon]|nr:hypothetical protein [Candidatus Woesearchaeota archaeon]
MKRVGVLILAFLLVSTVCALGVLPARSEVSSSPFEKEIRVRNTDGVAMKVSLQVVGDLAEYVSLSTDELVFDAQTGEQSFTYSVNAPEGTTGEAYILVQQAASGEATVSVSLRLKHRITIDIHDRQIRLHTQGTDARMLESQTAENTYENPEMLETSADSEGFFTFLTNSNSSQPHVRDAAVVIGADLLLAFIMVSLVLFVHARKHPGR